MIPKNIVQIGVGKWGMNYLKEFEEFPVKVNVATRDSWRALIEQKPDGVVVCTPPSTHIEIARFALERDVPVIIEKPLSLSLSEATTLLGYKAPILVNHLYLFSRGYQELKFNLRNIDITSIETVGIGTKAHEDYSALWDYGPHDIAMVLDLMGRSPERVTAETRQVDSGSTFEVELDFGSSQTYSMFGVAKKRERCVFVKCKNGNFTFRDEANEVPSPLHNAIETFLASIDGKQDSRIGVGLALEVCRIIEKCEKSIHAGTAVEY